MILNLVREGTEAHIYIYGDITSFAWVEYGEFSAVTLLQELEKLGSVTSIVVHINSYGGDVKEGLAIYNLLKNQSRKVTTICDGFACSIAALIFLAGTDRVMNEGSLLFIHNVYETTSGTAEELRKDADDLEKINDAMKELYISSGVTLTAEELQAKLDAETWLDASEALSLGFATQINAAAQTANYAGKIVKNLLKDAELPPLIPQPEPINTNKLKSLFGGKKQ
jgi:ATP-dependent protease ClpP protease subunit